MELLLDFLSGGRTDEGEAGLVLPSELVHSRRKARLLDSSSGASLRLRLSLAGVSSPLLTSV